MGDPTFLGADIGERLWPLENREGSGVAVRADNKWVEGELFVRPEDGAVVFRQIKDEGEKP